MPIMKSRASSMSRLVAHLRAGRGVRREGATRRSARGVDLVSIGATPPSARRNSHGDAGEHHGRREQQARDVQDEGLVHRHGRFAEILGRTARWSSRSQPYATDAGLAGITGSPTRRALESCHTMRVLSGCRPSPEATPGVPEPPERGESGAPFFGFRRRDWREREPENVSKRDHAIRGRLPQPLRCTRRPIDAWSPGWGL